MAISTKPFHPLDAEKNRRYKVKKKDAPKIAWHKTEETGPHDWEGYIRIPEDAEYTFTIQIDDNGYLEIDGQKVVELTGSNSSKKAEGKKTLKKGFHYAKLHHENLPVPEAIAPYPNAEEFVPKMGEADLELWEIDAPKNNMKAGDAAALLAAYNVYGYASRKSTDEVYAAIGGWLDREHTGGNPLYHHSCALRMSIGLSRFGVSLNGVPGANTILDEGDKTVLGGNEHVIISTDSLAAYISSKIGASDYGSFDDYSTPQPGDIALFHVPGEGSVGHMGMGSQENDFKEGSGPAQRYWLLYRSTLEDPETSAFK